MLQHSVRPNRLLHSRLSACTGLALLASVAAAAAQTVDDATSFDWSGVFVGVTAGIGVMSVSGTDTGRGAGPWIETGATQSDEAAGVLGGARLAYNWVHEDIVFGVEADLSAASLHLRQEASEVVAETDIDWLGTVRGRVGATLDQAPAPTLIYATGGLAVAGIEHTAGDTETTFSDGLFGPNTASGTRAGYTIGAGLETAVSERAAFGIEYLFMDFGTDTVNGVCVVCTGSPDDPIFFDFDTKLHTIRAHLTWKIGG